jgi:hypothetical protein
MARDLIRHEVLTAAHTMVVISALFEALTEFEPLFAGFEVGGEDKLRLAGCFTPPYRGLAAFAEPALPQVVSGLAIPWPSPATSSARIRSHRP